MRQGHSFSPEDVDYLDEVLANLKARSVAGGMKLAELAKDERCRKLADRFARAKKRAAGQLPKPPSKRRVPRETVDAIIADFFAGEMSQAAIARKHGFGQSYVHKIVRGLIRQGK